MQVPDEVPNIVSGLFRGAAADAGDRRGRAREEYDAAVTWLLRRGIARYADGRVVLCEEAGPLRPIIAVYFHYKNEAPVFVIDVESRVENNPREAHVSYYHDGVLWHRPHGEFFGLVKPNSDPAVASVRRFTPLIEARAWETRVQLVGRESIGPNSYQKVIHHA